jgi:recombination endonuclease VII
MVSRQAVWSKKRYAEDPEFRKRLVARALAHYTAHKAEITESLRERYRADPEYRERKRKRGRRISDDLYDVLFARQGGVCAICKRKHHGRLHADHCHTTGRQRRLLCPKCNLSLGLHNDDPDSMLAAVAYLEVWRQEIGSADAGVIAAGIVERLRRRLEVLVRAALALRRLE